MIDGVAQTGEHPPSASSFDQFAVQGEQRYWIHLAIDRLTGNATRISTFCVCNVRWWHLPSPRLRWLGMLRRRTGVSAR